MKSQSVESAKISSRFPLFFPPLLFPLSIFLPHFFLPPFPLPSSLFSSLPFFLPPLFLPSFFLPSSLPPFLFPHPGFNGDPSPIFRPRQSTRYWFLPWLGRIGVVGIGGVRFWGSLGTSFGSAPAGLTLFLSWQWDGDGVWLVSKTASLTRRRYLQWRSGHTRRSLSRHAYPRSFLTVPIGSSPDRDRSVLWG